MEMTDARAWAERAAGKLRFPPDRAGVERELLAHLADRKQDFLAQGLSDSAAEAAACAAMGDPDTAGALLNQVHKPFLGWLWRISRWLLIAGAVMLLWNFVLMQGGRGLSTWFSGNPLWNEDGYASSCYTLTNPGDAVVFRRVVSPKAVRARAGDYVFSVRRVSVSEYQSGSQPTSDLYLLLESKADRFWQAAPDDAVERMTVTDDRGNDYSAWLAISYWQDSPRDSRITGRLLDRCYYSLVTDAFPTDARWAELHYERMGVTMTLRIDLTGGEVYEKAA